MKNPGTILMSAPARLLEPTIPYRYFAMAILFHILLWGLVFIFADDVAMFAGGSGPGLAAVHSLTIGVLGAAAMGASFQMLPVASGVALRSVSAARLAFWFFLPGTVALLTGMALGAHAVMGLGGVSAALGLLIFIVLVADVLWRARSLGPVRYYGLAALGAFALAIALGLLLIVDEGHGLLDERPRIILIHLVLAAFGFMGLLVAGFSHVLLPLFALAGGVPEKDSRTGFVLAVLALLLALAGIPAGVSLLTASGLLTGLLAALLHIRAMQRCLSSGMRKNLGISLVMIRLSWGGLILALAAGLAASLGFFEDTSLRLFVFLGLFGWLLTFLLGILQRILPFLGSMNATGRGRIPPRPSQLAPERMLKAHALLHLLALLLTGTGIALESGGLVMAGGGAGISGALIYGGFALRVWWLIHGRPSDRPAGTLHPNQSGKNQ